MVGDFDAKLCYWSCNTATPKGAQYYINIRNERTYFQNQHTFFNIFLH